MSSEELGGSAYRKYDIEAWMPGRGSWGEVNTLPYSSCVFLLADSLPFSWRRPPTAQTTKLNVSVFGIDRRSPTQRSKKKSKRAKREQQTIPAPPAAQPRKEAGLLCTPSTPLLLRYRGSSLLSSKTDRSSTKGGTSLLSNCHLY
jgi:hypothetical protein